MNPTNILPIIIANNANQDHSPLGALCMVIGFAAVLLWVAVVVIRWSILDFIDNRRPERKAALAAYAAIYAAKRAKVQRDGEQLREYLAKNAK